MAGVSVVDVALPKYSLAGKIDILQIHWPDRVFIKAGRWGGMARAFAVLAVLAWLRFRSVKLVWCVHELEPHDAGWLYLHFWPIYMGVLSRLVHGFMTLSPSTEKIVRNHYRGLANKPSIFTWHPDYVVTRAANGDAERRAGHDTAEPQTKIAYFGTVRAYKGVDELLSCFRQTHDPRLRLAITGLAIGKRREALEDAARQDPRISLDLRMVEDDELEDAVLSADAVVLPFRKTFHSGSIVYALCCGKAVVTPRTPYAADLQAQIGSQWLRLYDPPLRPAHLAALHDLPQDAPDLDFLSIARSGPQLRQFYEQICRPQAA